MKLNFLFTTATCAASIALISPVFADATIATGGKSTFTIVIPNKASASVQEAARELQKDIELSTGAKLPLQKTGEKIKMPVISLGNTPQAKAAGISSQDMSDDTYRIVTKNGNLYILGIDTPDGGWTKTNGISNGTANGVYTFLEDYLDVRWVMPGELGRDVPRKSTFSIDNINRTETPLFNFRQVTQLRHYSNKEQSQTIRDWEEHMRIGKRMSPVDISYSHSWWRTINQSATGKRTNDINTAAVKNFYQEHPDWFAMDKNGKRPFPKTYYEKLETTNQGLVKWFAEQAIKNLKASERPETFPLSPSDGAYWSQSPESKALYDPSPSTLFDPEAPAGAPGMSSLVLKWYHDVAQVVEKEYPQGRLAGYIYSSYVYPPTKVNMKLPDNFTPVICGIGTYGYGLYRPRNQERWKWVMDSWAKVAPKNWYYYDLPNQLLRQYRPELGKDNFPGSTGIITPSAPDILHIIFPTLVKNHIKGANIYGTASWSNAALANYMLAKLEWNPKLDAYEVQREWLRRAYGADAGKVMEQFYLELNGWFRDYYQQHQNVSYKLTRDMLKTIYAAHYPEMEKLLLQAKSQQMTEKQQKRLQLIVDNMIVLQWRLRNAGLLSEDFQSPLQCSDVQINALLTQSNEAFPLFPAALPTRKYPNKPKPFPAKVQFSENALPGKSTFAGRDNFILYAAQDGDIRIEPQQVTHDAYFAGYTIWNQAGEIMDSGLLNGGTPIIIHAKKDAAYYLHTAVRKPVRYTLVVKNARIAEGSFENNTLTLSGAPASVYVYSPQRDVPLGIFEEGNSVIIKKPFSGMAGIAALLKSGHFKDVKVIASLDEDWRFSPDPKNDGLQRGVEKPEFDDSAWKTISALNWWQFQGFPDYLGAAWYRKKFNVKQIPRDRIVYLYFGAVDGNAEIYLNGEKIREHVLGKDYKGWNKAFGTYQAKYKLKPGENTLAVKVTSKPVGSSGIFKGVSLLTATRIR